MGPKNQRRKQPGIGTQEPVEVKAKVAEQAQREQCHQHREMKVRFTHEERRREGSDSRNQQHQVRGEIRQPEPVLRDSEKGPTMSVPKWNAQTRTAESASILSSQWWMRCTSATCRQVFHQEQLISGKRMTRAGELCRTLHHRRCAGRVQDKEVIHPNQQQFSFAEKQLEDDCLVKPHNRGESMLWLASSYLEHEATSQEGVKNFHLCLSLTVTSCDLNFASCVNDENVYYIRDELTSDKMVLESITPGSAILVELEEVDVTSKCAIQSPWSASGFSIYRAISATPVGGAALHEIAVSSAKEVDMLMIVATSPTIENVWEEGAQPECVNRNLFV